uniref:Uncharacterized protein n=1 Tax=Anguilla anguilla TaxID=7936 RepID=A0A0E9QVI0_ANGAN
MCLIMTFLAVVPKGSSFRHTKQRLLVLSRPPHTVGV